ncbi:MAG: ABC transporter ATP-binding protein [Verrucomicrobiales bacterium]|jgi:ABC-type lipoprotein export system ATPase subunit|nr:ABC transporter ATP-binding protein [Verrucomicrobiales bacterium]
MSEEILQLKQVTKWYESDPSRKILEGLDLTVTESDRFAIVGPSGCGKSTLLNLLGTLDEPSEGEVIVGGVSTAGLSETELAQVRASEIGFIFQMHHLLPQCTALENVLVPTLAHRESSDSEAVAKRAKDLLGRVGLSDKSDSLPSQLSGGERQRVAVVRALINRPRLLLADEPTGALDEKNATNLIELLVDLNESEGLALIVVTHDAKIAQSVGEVKTLRGGKLENS